MHERWVSGLGAIILLAFAFACCPRERRREVRPRTIVFGLALLFGFAALVLETKARVVFVWLNAAVDRLLDFSARGSAFVFGPLASDHERFGFVFAFQILPTIVFFAALMSMLYHVGLMPFVIEKLGRLLARWLGTSGAESFSTVADIFVGQTEAPLVIQPYVAELTESELMACMTAGFATTAGGVLAAYVLMLGAYVPEIAGHLIACSVMSAPASLVIAKLMLPETSIPLTRGVAPRELPRTSVNLLDAAAAGTLDGLRLALNVGAMLIVFVALTALCDFALERAGALFHLRLNLERIFSTAFWPLSWLMGIPSQDVAKVAALLGQKTVLNEFVAYSTMAEALSRDPNWLAPRSRVIASYALCGFANFGSIGIQIAGYSSLAPERRADLARLGPRAMLAGLLTTCLVACVAGMLVA